MGFEQIKQFFKHELGYSIGNFHAKFKLNNGVFKGRSYLIYSGDIIFEDNFSVEAASSLHLLREFASTMSTWDTETKKLAKKYFGNVLNAKRELNKFIRYKFRKGELRVNPNFNKNILIMIKTKETIEKILVGRG